MVGDWVRLYRAMLDHPVMQDDFLCRLWVWCLLRANYRPGRFRGDVVSPGSFVTGRNTASIELNVNPSKWYRGMQRLSEIGCVTMKANSNWTTVTVCKWGTYQPAEAPERTSPEQPANSQRTQEKEGKNNTKPPYPPRGKRTKRPGISLEALSDVQQISLWLERGGKCLGLEDGHATWIVAASERAIEHGGDPVGMFISLAKEIAAGDTNKLEKYYDRDKERLRAEKPGVALADSKGINDDDE